MAWPDGREDPNRPRGPRRGVTVTGYGRAGDAAEGQGTDGQAGAREAAFADARARAEQYATLAGRALGDVLDIREDDGEPGGDVHEGSGDAEREREARAAVTVRWAFAD
jgi:hypothetical protein